MNQNLSESIPNLQKWKCCLLIPTYNNAPVLREVLLSLSDLFPFLIVVNDGSTDETFHILSAFQNDFDQVHLHQNSGKGIALKTGFERAKKLGYNYVLTLDSDGQHLASDIPVFLDALEKHPGSLVVGARNMGQENVPGTSSFGHKFSNFWFQIMTGKKLPDTQCGYRLYPIYRLKNLDFYTSKYEFEMEVLVRGVWQGIDVFPVPINVYYPPDDERITHFRKGIDFTRIFILNTLLVALGLLWYRPQNFFRRIREMNPRQIWNEYVLSSDESNFRLSLAVMLGLFIGVSPLWGYQIVTIILMCHVLKLNKVLALITGNISLPPMIPLIVWGSYQMGGFFVDAPPIKNIKTGTDGTFDLIKENLFQYIIGSLSLGVVLAIFGGLISFILLSIFRKN